MRLVGFTLDGGRCAKCCDDHVKVSTEISISSVLSPSYALVMLWPSLRTAEERWVDPTTQAAGGCSVFPAAACVRACGGCPSSARTSHGAGGPPRTDSMSSARAFAVSSGAAWTNSNAGPWHARYPGGGHFPSLSALHSGRWRDGLQAGVGSIQGRSVPMRQPATRCLINGARRRS